MKGINVRFKEEDIKILNEIARETDTNLSSVIRKGVGNMIEDYLDYKEVVERLESPDRELISEEELIKRLGL